MGWPEKFQNYGDSIVISKRLDQFLFDLKRFDSWPNCDQRAVTCLCISQNCAMNDTWKV